MTSESGGTPGVEVEVAGQPQLVSLYPPPPHCYFTHYTDENVSAGTAPHPPHPPHLPTDTYHIFGVPHQLDATIIQDLEWQGIEPLYSKPCDRKLTMRRMNASLLVNFLDLLHIMKSAPNSCGRAQKVEDVEMLFIQLHHLLNTYRTMQARITLVCIRQHQMRQTARCCRRLAEAFDQVGALLVKCRDMGGGEGESSGEETLDDILRALRARCGEQSREADSDPTQTAYCVICDQSVEVPPYLLADTFAPGPDCATSSAPGSDQLMQIVTDALGEDNVSMETGADDNQTSAVAALWQRYDALLRDCEGKRC